MHELAVTENLLEIALRHANKAGAEQIKELHIVIGDLTSFIDDSILFYWDIIAKDTIAESAVLNFKRIPTKFHCQDCNQSYSPDDTDLACKFCGSTRITIQAGKEFYLESIEINS